MPNALDLHTARAGLGETLFAFFAATSWHELLKHLAYSISKGKKPS